MMINIIGNAIGAQRGGSSVNEAFEFTVKTDNAGTSAADQFTIPITSATPYDISTSDGHSITGATGATTLTFSAPGTYTVSITESCDGWQFNNGGDKLKLLNISNWGVYTNNRNSSFHGASNMTCSATDAPINTHTTMYRAFYNCTNFNGAIGNWDVSNVTDYSQFVAYTQFNQPLANWSINTVGPVNFRYMFWLSPFNQDISGWDTSAVTNMSFMFNANAAFNQDISSWDVSSVTNFESMFASASSFDQPLNSWNVSAATNMAGMFGTISWNYPLDSWDVSNVTNMRLMFNRNPAFNQDLNSWDVSNVTNMEQMFNNQFGAAGQFNGNITNWDTSSVTSMRFMFNNQQVFNQDISGWNVSSVTTFESMFEAATAFNQPIGAWNLSGINIFRSLQVMFRNAWAFDQDLSNWSQYLTAAPVVTSLNSMFSSATAFNNGGQPMNWDVSNITDFGALFNQTHLFNQDLGAWDMSSAVSLGSMFQGARSFNNGGSPSISNWDTSNVTNMSKLYYAGGGFSLLPFNQPIGNWNTSNVTTMREMFYYNQLFNQPIGNWDTSNVTDMTNMFYLTVIDQDLSNWNIGSIPPNSGNFNWNARAFSTINYDAMLVAYEAQVPPVGLTWNMGNATYTLGSAAEAARTSLINTYGWTITDGGGIFYPMIISVDTTLGDGLDNYTLNFNGSTYDVSTSDGQNITGNTGPTTITFPSAGVYDITISGTVTSRSFASDLKLVDIKQWGSIDTSLAYEFSGANSLTTITAPDQPYNLTSLSALFYNAQNFAGGISHWNTSSVTQMVYAFYNTSFDEDISSWDVSNVTNMEAMFRLTPFNNGGSPNINNWDTSSLQNMKSVFQTASLFNQPIGGWDVSNVTSMVGTFFQASSFNQPLDSWDVSNVTSMDNTFQSASSFNQDLNSWNLASVTDITNMFQSATAFNGDISSWAFPNVTSFVSLFQAAVNFNQDISSWDVSNVTNMQSAFRQANAFNQDISSWDVSNVTNMASMFFDANAFNQPLNIWDTSSVTNMSYMFYSAGSFNQPLNFWETGNVTTFEAMFYGTSFNYPIAMWDTSSLVNINQMFESNTSFNQDISNWNILSLNGDFSRFFRFSGGALDETNYDELLVSWNNQLEAAYPGGVGYPNTVTIAFGNSNYSLGGDAEAARTNIITNFGWTITDGGAVSNPFVFVVKTDQAGGVSATDQFAFPLDASSTVNATVDWGDGNINTITAYNDPNATHTYATAGTYTISVTGILNGWRFNNGGDRFKLLDITQWGIFDMNLDRAFHGCQNLTGSWTDHPRIGNTMLQSFANCFAFTGDVSEFSTVGVTTMQGTLQLHYSGNNANVSNWDVSSVTSLGAFCRDSSLNVDLSSWDVRNVTNFTYMFYSNSRFNQDISMWKPGINYSQPTVISIFQFIANRTAVWPYDYGFYGWPVNGRNYDGNALIDNRIAIPTSEYDKTLIAWSDQMTIVPNFQTWHFGGSQYTLGGAAEAARNNLINNYNFTFVDGGGIAPPLLDTYTGAAAAYSLRDLSSSTTSVVRVRRSSDNTEQDFTSTQVADGTLTTFVGAGNDGFVTVWYDQSGNNNHATQTNTAQQPVVVLSGVLVTEGGVPMIDYTTTLGKRLTLTTPVAYSNSVYTFFGNGTKESSTDAAFLGGSSGSFEFRFGTASSVTALRQSQQNLGGMTIPTNTGHYAVSCRVNQTRPEYVANTTSGSGFSAGNFTQPVSLVGIASGEDFEGKMGDWILYDTDQWTNQAAIQANINSYYTIY